MRGSVGYDRPLARSGDMFKRPALNRIVAAFRPNAGQSLRLRPARQPADVGFGFRA